MSDGSSNSHYRRETSYLSLRKQLNDILNRKGISAAALSRSSGVPKQTISDWLAGREPKALGQLVRIAEALGVGLDEMCLGNKKTSAPDLVFGTEDWSGFEILLRKKGSIRK